MDDVSKIVISLGFGGFVLSDKGIKRYAEIKGITLFEEKFNGHSVFLTKPLSEIGDEPFFRHKFNVDSIERTDPALVQMIEELGDEAADNYHPLAAFEIVTLPKGTKYRIQEYDGDEWVETENDIVWSIA